MNQPCSRVLAGFWGPCLLGSLLGALSNWPLTFLHNCQSVQEQSYRSLLYVNNTCNSPAGVVRKTCWNQTTLLLPLCMNAAFLFSRKKYNWSEQDINILKIGACNANKQDYLQPENVIKNSENHIIYNDSSPFISVSYNPLCFMPLYSNQLRLLRNKKQLEKAL